MQCASLSLCLSQIDVSPASRTPLAHVAASSGVASRSPFSPFPSPLPLPPPCDSLPASPVGGGGGTKKNIPRCLIDQKRGGRRRRRQASVSPQRSLLPSVGPRAGWMNPCARRPPRRKPRFGGTNLAVLLGPSKRNPFYSNGTQSAVLNLFRTTQLEGRFGKCHPKQQWRRRGPEEGGEGGAKKVEERGNQGGKWEGRKE